MNIIIKKLSVWGCDMVSALERFVGDDELYISLLNEYKDKFRLDDLEKYIREGNVCEAFDIAHDLKGSVGNLGINPLYNIIVKIVESLRKGNCDGLLPLVNELKAKKKELDDIMK